MCVTSLLLVPYIDRKIGNECCLLGRACSRWVWIQSNNSGRALRYADRKFTGCHCKVFSFIYNMPILQVAVIIGELMGRFTNAWIQDMSIRRNHGVFEAESRLWYAISPL